MSRSQALVAEDVLDAFPARAARAPGSTSAAAKALSSPRSPRAGPHLDLIAVRPAARRGASAPGAGAARPWTRVRVVGGDFLARRDCRRGADVVSLVRVLHDHDDESALLLLRRAHAALPPGGRLLIAEPMAATRGAEPVGDAYFGFYLLAMGRGRARTPNEIAELVRQRRIQPPRGSCEPAARC